MMDIIADLTAGAGQYHEMKPLLLDPRTNLFFILLCVLIAMFAPNLYFQFTPIAVNGLPAVLCGKWQYALV